MPIVVEKLNHAYMEGSGLAHDALKDITLTVKDGEFLGLIGHTGSGKSTFVQHLNGLLQPSSGKVVVDGFDMADKKQRMQGRRLVGMVFQYPEYQLFEETVAKDIAFGLSLIHISCIDVPTDAMLRGKQRNECIAFSQYIIGGPSVGKHARMVCDEAHARCFRCDAFGKGRAQKNFGARGYDGFLHGNLL